MACFFLCRKTDFIQKWMCKVMTTYWRTYHMALSRKLLRAPDQTFLLSQTNFRLHAECFIEMGSLWLNRAKKSKFSKNSTDTPTSEKRGSSVAGRTLFFSNIKNENCLWKYFFEILLVWRRKILPHESSRLRCMRSQKLKSMECKFSAAKNHQCRAKGYVAHSHCNFSFKLLPTVFPIKYFMVRI